MPKGTSYYDISGAANVKISKKTFNKKLKKMVGSRKMTNVARYFGKIPVAFFLFFNYNKI